MRHDALQGDEAAVQQVDRDRIAIRPKMRARDLQLLAVAASPQNSLAPARRLQSLAQMPQAEMRITISRTSRLGRATCSLR